ncbi:MAG: outer membrane homotrimeric porin, partial [Deltaproteobacteria bacterium]|nr:outer membrane homotrimeric porin [Deltaproteobacteria bacterium]
SLVAKEDSGYHTDRARFRQRVRTQIRFIADETLSGLLNLETNLHWGAADSAPGRLDADEAYFVIKHAYLDWTLPNTRIMTRMGMQGLRFPTAAFGNPVMDADVAGVTATVPFSPEVSLTAFWARPFDTSYDADQDNGRNMNDDMDFFGFMLPIQTGALRLTPWAAFGLIGKDSEYFGGDRGRGPSLAGNTKVRETALAWWVGGAFELPALDPYFVKIDAMAGGLDTGDSAVDSWGYLLAGDLGYRFDFGSLSVIGWYASGDKDADKRRTMPIISDDGGFYPTLYGTGGSRVRSWDRALSATGLGMWGIGLQLADLSFVDRLKHTARVVYMGGTNEGDAIDRRSVHDSANLGDELFGKQFLMSSDRAWEVNLLNDYMVNENLAFNLDFAYVWLDLGDHWTDKKDTEGSFAAMLGVTYSF